MIRRLRRWLRPFLTEPWRGKMEEEEILKALSLTEENPTWKALECLLEEAIEESVQIVSTYQTAEKPGLLTHTAGGIEALREFRSRLRELRAKAMDKTQT